MDTNSKKKHLEKTEKNALNLRMYHKQIEKHVFLMQDTKIALEG